MTHPYRTRAKLPPRVVEEVPLRHDEKFWWRFLWLADDCDVSADTLKQSPLWALWAVMLLRHANMFPEYYKEGMT